MHAFSLGRSVRLIVGVAFLFVTAVTLIAQTEKRASADPASVPAATRALARRAIVEGLTEPVQNLSITDLQGRDISGQVDPRMEGGKLTLNLAQPSAVVLRQKTVPTLKVGSGEKIILPGGAVVPLPPIDPATGSVSNKAIWFRLTFAASPMPAPWDDKEGSYVTRLTFGLRKPEGAPANLSLDQPVIIKLAYRGLVAPETAMISLDAPGLENEKTIALNFTPQSDKPTILLRSSISEVDLELTALPRLNIFTDRDPILGLGLDVATVTITNVRPDGRSAPVDRIIPVNVTVEGGARFEPAAVAFAAGEPTTRFNLRSSGLGSITIRANADGITGATLLRQTFPTGPLAAALMGGALGGFARRFVKGARRASHKRRVIEGLVVSSIVFVAGVLGVAFLNLPSAVVSTEAGAFLTGALGGFVGVTVIEQMTRKTRTVDA